MFFWKIIEELDIIIILHFYNIYDILGSVTLRMNQIRFSPRLRPAPRWGNSWRSPESLVGWGKRYFLPISFPSTPAAPHL